MNLHNLVDYCKGSGLSDPFSGASVPSPLNIDTVKSAIMIRCGLLTPVYQEPETFTEVTTHWFNTKQWTFEHLIKVIQSEYSPIENVFEERTETNTYGSSHLHSGGYKDASSGKDTTTHSEKDSTERSFDNYHDKTERSFDNYHDATERTHTNYKDDTDHTYTNYKETTTKSGSEVTENQISAFNSSGYQADNKSATTYGENIGGSPDVREDEKSITGSNKDSRTISGSYKDDRTETGTYADDRTETGTYKDETVYGHKITLDNGKTITRTYQDDKDSHVGKDELKISRHGNVGTVSSMHLIEEELELLRHFDIYGYIAKLFEEDNMIMVY